MKHNTKTRVTKKEAKKIESTMIFNRRIEAEQPFRVYLKVKQTIDKMKERMETGWCLVEPLNVYREDQGEMLKYTFSANIIFIGPKLAGDANHNLSGKNELKLYGFEKNIVEKVFSKSNTTNEIELK
jgi:hypothetical protein